jgi:hypothetical protein
MLFLRRLSSICLVCAVVVACGTDPAGPPAELEGLAGDDQVGTVGQTLADPIRVRVIDSDGRGVPDVWVRVSVAEDGGSVASLMAALGAAGYAVLADPTILVLTDGTGEAQVNWTLGPTAGAQSLQATVTLIDPLEFSATAEPGPPAALDAAGGDGQLAVPGAELAEPLLAKVVDEYGNSVPMAGLTVAWEVSGGGGSLSTLESETDAAGQAPTVLTLGPQIGFNTVIATQGELVSFEFAAMGLALVQPDAAEDTFSSGISGDAVLPDILAFGTARDGDSLIVAMRFKDRVAMARAGGPNAVAGLVEFDIDLNEATGLVSQLDMHRPGPGSTGMGVDVIVDLFGDPDGSYVIFDSGQNIIGVTVPDIRGRIICFGVPSALLGTGDLRTAAITGTIPEPTDIVPNDGSVFVGGAGGAPVTSNLVTSGSRLPALAYWGPVGTRAREGRRRR